eukprot:UN19276
MVSDFPHYFTDSLTVAVVVIGFTFPGRARISHDVWFCDVTSQSPKVEIQFSKGLKKLQEYTRL